MVLQVLRIAKFGFNRLGDSKVWVLTGFCIQMFGFNGFGDSRVTFLRVLGLQSYNLMCLGISKSGLNRFGDF